MTTRIGSKGAGRSTALTPLLDMLFLLLFTLLATSRSAESLETEGRPSEEIAIELPQVSESGGASSGAAVPLTLTIDASGTVTLEGSSPSNPAALREALERRRAGGAEVAIELRADGDARHAVVADVLQAVRAAGVIDVRIVALAGSDARGGFGAQEGDR